MAENTKQQLLARAAARMGHAALAKQLNIPESLLDAWIRGLASMPDRKLLLLAALIEKAGDDPKNADK